MVHSYFSYGALAVGLLPSVFGINALFRPESTLRAVEFPVPAEPEARKLTRSLMRIYGIRNVAISYAMALIWSTGNEKLTGLSLVGGLAICITDGLVSRVQIGGGEWNHWSFAPVIGGIMAGLFGVFS